MKPMSKLLLQSAADKFDKCTEAELQYFSEVLAKNFPATAERLKNSIGYAQQELDREEMGVLQ